MSQFDQDDNDFLTPANGSGLAFLFGGSGGSGANPSFHYTPPKQPKKQKGGGQEGHHILATLAVVAHKHVDGHYMYVPQGKLGCALLELYSS